MPVTLPSISRTRTRVGSLRDSLTWTDNQDRLVDVASFRARRCYDAFDLIDPCADDAKTLADGPGVIEVPVFAFYDGEVCTTAADPEVLTRATEDAAAAAELHLSHNVERGLWNGGAGAVPANDEWFLASSGADDINSGVASGIVSGLSDLVEALDSILGGVRGIIHVPHFLVPFLTFYGQLDRQGNILSVQNTDHIVIAGTGYDGADPDGNVTEGEPWIYGTGPVSVFLSPAINTAAVDWEINRFEARTEYSAVTIFDPCAHIGVPVCIPDPGPECGAS